MQKFLDEVLKKHIKDLADKNNFSFEALDSLLGRSDVKSLNDALAETIEKLAEQDRVNYANSFKNTLRSIEKFYKNAIPFNKITPSFLQNFHEKLEKDGLKKSSIGFIMRNIRTVINNNASHILQGDDIHSDVEILYSTGSGRISIYLISNSLQTIRATKTRTLSRFMDFLFLRKWIEYCDLCG